STPIQCAAPSLTLDTPAASYAELASRRVVGIELRGAGVQDIIIKNNRSTPELADDVELKITQAPLFYDEKKNLIWTDGAVQVLDLQTMPDPTRITAMGMELHLVKDSGTG